MVNLSDFNYAHNGVYTPYLPALLPRKVDQAKINDRYRTMTTTIEKDSPLVPIVLMALVLMIFIGGALSLAYMGGVFTGKSAVMANDQRIENEASQKPPVH